MRKAADIFRGAGRGMAGFFGGFTLLNLVGDYYSLGFDSNGWWIELRFLPRGGGMAGRRQGISPGGAFEARVGYRPAVRGGGYVAGAGTNPIQEGAPVAPRRAHAAVIEGERIGASL